MISKNKRIILVSFGLIVVGATLSIGNGCSKQYLSKSSSVIDGAGGVLPSSSASSDIEIIPGARTASLVYSKQVLDQLSSCAGLASPSDKTISMYQQKQGAISTYGYVNTVTSPMMMAVTSIAGEICNDLIAQEVASGPRLFVGYNFRDPVLPNSTQIYDSISRIALSCWQRRENEAEKQMLSDMITSSVGAAEPMGSQKSALMICTAMLSSLDSLLN